MLFKIGANLPDYDQTANVTLNIKLDTTKNIPPLICNSPLANGKYGLLTLSISISNNSLVPTIAIFAKKAALIAHVNRSKN